MTPFARADSYKLSHWTQYPEGTEKVYSNFTPRRSRLPGIDRFVFFGLQAFLSDMVNVFEDDFFSRPKEEAVSDFDEFYREFFGSEPLGLSEKVAELHDIGYLPLDVWALPEGSVVRHGIPVFTIENTKPECFWLTNFIESWMSSEIWHPCTSATTAYWYRKMFNKYAEETSLQDWMPEFQGHDFSFRGLEGIHAASASGAAHLLSFKGTDNCPAIFWIKGYYPGDNGLLGTSVPATEHSVMCSGSEAGEFDTYKRLITEVYPSGIVSIVSDTWDFWRVVSDYLPRLKGEIMARDGKVVIRPDSSPKTPVEIICGDPEASANTPEGKGLCRCLYETFGGTKNSKDYIELDPHIGMIYGEAITLDMQEKILAGLRSRGFASTNIVMGIGSYTYQMATRDSHGIAIKATNVTINGVDIPISKDPKTDNSGKKSASGLLKVYHDHRTGELELQQNVSRTHLGTDNAMRPVFLNGTLLNTQSFADVREVLARGA